MSLSENLSEAVVEYGPKLLKAAAKILAGAIVGAISMAIYKNHSFKVFLKEHDRKTAKKMRKEIEKKLKAIKEKYQNNEDLLKRKMYDLCREFCVDPEKVF